MPLLSVLKNCRRLKIYVNDKMQNGNKVSNIKLGNFKPDYGKRLYRFGLLADVHNQKATIIDDDRDFINALTFFNNKAEENTRSNNEYTYVVSGLTYHFRIRYSQSHKKNSTHSTYKEEDLL